MTSGGNNGTLRWQANPRYLEAQRFLAINESNRQRLSATDDMIAAAEAEGLFGIDVPSFDEIEAIPWDEVCNMTGGQRIAPITHTHNQGHQTGAMPALAPVPAHNSATVRPQSSFGLSHGVAPARTPAYHTVTPANPPPEATPTAPAKRPRARRVTKQKDVGRSPSITGPLVNEQLQPLAPETAPTHSSTPSRGPRQLVLPPGAGSSSTSPSQKDAPATTPDAPAKRGKAKRIARERRALLQTRIHLRSTPIGGRLAHLLSRLTQIRASSHTMQRCDMAQSSVYWASRAIAHPSASTRPAPTIRSTYCLPPRSTP